MIITWLEMIGLTSIRITRLDKWKWYFKLMNLISAGVWRRHLPQEQLQPGDWHHLLQCSGRSFQLCYRMQVCSGQGRCSESQGWHQQPGKDRMTVLIQNKSLSLVRLVWATSRSWEMVWLSLCPPILMEPSWTSQVTSWACVSRWRLRQRTCYQGH